MTQREYLVAYDYGMGGLWAVMMAPSAEAITAVYPELGIADERPSWMDDDKYDVFGSERCHELGVVL